MQIGSNWGGNYSRFSYDESKQHLLMLKEQGVPLLDDELNLAQEILLNLIRRSNLEAFGEGTRTDGFKIVGTGATNDFTITGGDGSTEGAGRIFVSGYPVMLASDTTYSTQPVSQSPLTTPALPRTDEVYLDVWLDEIDSIADPTIVDPSIAIETNRRLGLNWAVKVAEGSTTPPSYTDGDNLRHHTLHIATLNRTTSAAIDSGMVVDKRSANRPSDPRISRIITVTGQTEDQSDDTQLFDAVRSMTSLQQTVIKTVIQDNFVGSVPNAVEWDASSTTDVVLWNISDPTKMVVPSGFNSARCVGGLSFNRYTSVERSLRVYMNGNAFSGAPAVQIPPVTTAGNRDMLNVVSGWVPVVPGDYFELVFIAPAPNGSFQYGNDALALLFSWFTMEVKNTIIS
ncbi:MAG: hypothetical protein ACU843_07420 [Gammaproteobacteria bacterium]